MKIYIAVASIGIGLLLGAGVGSLRESQAKTELMKETVALRAQVDQAVRSETKAIAQLEQSKAEADRLRQWGEEVHGLRSEASRLRRELAEAQASLQLSVDSSKRAEAISKAQPTEKVQSVDKGAKVVGKGDAKADPGLPLESAPPAVGAVITREIGDGQLRFLHAATEGGKSVYGVKGQLADGRSIGMRLAEDGTVLEKSTEIPADTLPVQVQNPVAQTFGDINISSARQIIDGANVSYELGAKGPNMGMQIMVREDGTIMAYSAKFRAPEPKTK